ncbi:MAG: phytoene/squalene synthase family protein [Acidimicrobiia bacterium]
MASSAHTPVTLEQSYAECRTLARRYGTTYYWATAVLPRVKRHHVHALYAFCRYADEIVDERRHEPIERRIAALDEFGERFFYDLAMGESDHLVLRAVVHTCRAFELDTEMFRRFLKSMAMDFTVVEYRDYGHLCEYMDGSAAVIGEMMLPILEPLDKAAFGHARDLGNAFQLTNFLRDVAEDLDRGRVYLPQDDLARFGADPHRRRVDEPWRDLMRFEIERCHGLYESADLGIAMLPAPSAHAIKAARILYGEILDRIEANDYDVFTTRARVPLARKLSVAARLTYEGRRRMPV